MFSLFSTISTHEKDLAILEIVKNAEKEKEKLNITIVGLTSSWVHEWIQKRGHRIATNSNDLTIFIDIVDERKLQEICKVSKYVAAILPSNKQFELNNNRLVVTKNIFYGLFSIHFIGFSQPTLIRYQFSFIVWLLTFFVLFASISYPTDDLLRHVKAYEYGYAYANLFAYSWNFSFNPYLLFDYFVGFLDANFQDVGLKLTQMLCFTVFSIGFFLHTKNWDDRFRAIIFILLLSVVIHRIILARPTVFESFLFLTGLTLSGLPAILFGIFMGSFYYLFPIFIAPLAFIKKEYFLSLFMLFIVWLSYAGQDYFSDIIFFISSIIQNRLLPIEENLSLLTVLKEPIILLFAYLFIKSQNFKYALPILFFILFNQVRFLEIIVPLLAISLDEKKIGFDKLRFGFLEHVFLILILISSIGFIIPYNNLEKIQIHDAQVFCDTMECMFNTVYTSNNITISPSMELGLTEKAVQFQMQNILLNGTIDCNFFKNYSYDFVIERHLKEIPSCLRLADVAGTYRIWEIQSS